MFFIFLFNLLLNKKENDVKNDEMYNPMKETIKTKNTNILQVNKELLKSKINKEMVLIL